MKRILKMLTAINFTGLSVLPIIACGSPSSNSTAIMNGKVADQLRLTSNNGTMPEKKATINNTAKLDSVYWSIPGQGTSATILLTDSTQNSKTANTESYDFITTVLGVKPISGNNFATGVFDFAVLNNIKIHFSNIKVSLTVNKTLQDYTVFAGTFDAQFKDDKDNSKSPIYSFNVKPDDTKGVINDIIPRFNPNDLDVATNPNTLFVLDGIVPIGCIPGAVINLNNTATDVTKKMNLLISITNKKINILVSSQNAGTPGIDKWATRKELIIKFTTDNGITFNVTRQLQMT